jgi:hypothetical protein
MKFIKGSKKELLIIGSSALISCALYLTYSAFESGLGFPLDDAWIHQTFARNLAYNGEWSFIVGQTSGASTGPLWGMILSVLYFLNIPPIWGTYFIGFLSIWALGIGGLNLGIRLFPNSKSFPLVLGLMCTMDWHLVWAALSGMETLLVSLLSLLIFCWLLDKRDNWGMAGLMVGLTIWIRPDGLTLVGPALLSLILRGYKKNKIIGNLIGFLGGLLVIVIPYFLFNYIVAGDIWPNTFYAKQAEYEFLREQGFLTRIGTVSYQIIIGIGIVILPGLVNEIIDALKKVDWERIGAIMWAVGYILIYAWRLPVAYQHGRYIIPIMPVVFLLGLTGMLRLIKMNSTTSWQRILSRSWFAIAGITMMFFLILGARSFAWDVGVINTEMVDAAEWISKNTSEDVIIAAHDIGALGYFGDRQVRDLAGLISQDVIPFLGDDEKLAQYLDDQNVDYLYTFMDWYPSLTSGLDIAYQSSGDYGARFGFEKTAIYYWIGDQ